MMSDESKFWIAINFIIVFGVVCFSLVIADYYKNYDRQIVEMVRQGEDPIAAMCAMANTHGNDPTCVILATKK